MSNLARIQLPILIYTLEQIADQSDLALQGAMAFSENTTRQAVDNLRRFKSQLAGITTDARSLVDSTALTDLKRNELVEILNRIEKADNFIPLWCRRYENVYDKSAQYLSVQGCHNLIDCAIPLVWDWSSDLLIFWGELNSSMLQAFNERGQKRVLIVNPRVDEKANSLPLPLEMKQVTQLEDAESYFSNLGTLCERIAVFESPSLGLSLSDQKKDEIKDVVAKLSSLAFTGQTTTRALASQWLKQGMRNLPQIAQSPSLKHLKDAFKDKPLVIVSPGPSLDKNIAQLKAIKGKAIILAAVQSAKALTEHGITADLMMVIDPKDFSYVLEGADISGVNALIAGVTCNQNFVQKPFKKVIFCNVNNELDAWATDIFGDTAIYGGGGSVSVSALRLALFTGANPIALVGQDLALTNGKVYSSGSVLSGVDVEVDEETGSFAYKNCSEDFLRTGAEQGEDRRNGRAKVFKLPGYYGGEVFTRPDFHFFHHEFVSIAKEVKRINLQFELYNCTEGGAFIEGFEHISLRDWIKKIDNQAYFHLEDDLEKYFQSINWILRNKQLNAQVQLMKTNLREANKLARECRIELQKTINEKNNKPVNKKIGQIEKKLIQSVKKIPFISYLMQEHLNSQIIRQDAIQTNMGHNMAAMSLYQLIIEGCESTLELLQFEKKVN